jgi:ribonuclease VapC
MVLDTSALVAILQDEAERRRFLEVIAAAASVSMSTATFVEVSIVARSPVRCEALVHLDRFLERAGSSSSPSTSSKHAKLATPPAGSGRGDMSPG